MIDVNNIEQVKELASKLKVNWYPLWQTIKDANKSLLRWQKRCREEIEQLKSIYSDEQIKENWANLKDRVEHYEHCLTEQYPEEYQQEAIDRYVEKRNQFVHYGDDFVSEYHREARYKVSIPESESQLRCFLCSWFGEGYKWLTAFDSVADWLTDNKNRGLFMFGNCGTGKTIMCKIISSLVRMQCLDYDSEKIKMYSAWKLNNNKDDILNDFKEESSYLTIIDDIGVESPLNDYGNKSMVFSEIVDVADRYCKLLVISTNLNLDELRQLYGDRTVDRLKGMCRFIAFEGESLRKVE